MVNAEFWKSRRLLKAENRRAHHYKSRRRENADIENDIYVISTEREAGSEIRRKIKR